ncbi:MAG: L-fucose/L-arabinose isomerase family protein [Paludibacter sp.]
MMKSKMKVGIFGIGLDTYWPQFDGLLSRLLGYQNQISKEIEAYQVEVVDCGMVDNPTKAKAAADLLKHNDVELVFLYISTYALSSTVLPVIQKLNVRTIILNLQPTASIDYKMINGLGDRGKMTGEWLANCQACSVPEIANVFNRSGLKYEIVSGYLNDNEAWTEISEWIDAAKVAYAMRNNRMGILGNYYGGMLDVYTDITKQSAVFGTHFEILEMCQLKALRDEVTQQEIDEKIAEFHAIFIVDKACEMDEIVRAAHTSVALDKLIAHYNLGSMAYYYEGHSGNDYENMVTSVIAGNTLLTGKNIPIAGECEVKNAQAMKIMSEFGVGGSFSEFYGMDFNDDVVMLGHDGPAHTAIAEGEVKLVPLPIYHGKPGKGLSIQMSVKQGAVTILSVVEGNDGVSLLIAEGMSVAGETLQIGNTNSRYKFPISAKQFMNNWSKAGPSHHCAIGVGHIGSKIEKLASLLNIGTTVIC